MRYILLSDLFSIWGFSQVSLLLNLRLTARGLSASSIGALGTVAMLVGALMALPAGLYVDIVGPSIALVTAAICLAVGAWGQVLGSSHGGLIVAYSLTGISTSIYMAAKIPALKQNSFTRDIRQTIALVRGYSSLVVLGGGAAATLLCHLTGSIGTPLLVGAALVSIAVVPLIQVPRRTEKVCLWVASWRPNGRPLFHLSLSFALATVALSLLYPATHLLLMNRGFNSAQISLCLAVLQCGPVAAWPLIRSLTAPTIAALRFTILGLAVLAVGLQFRDGPFWFVLLLLWQILGSVVGSLYLSTFSTSGTPGLTFGW